MIIYEHDTEDVQMLSIYKYKIVSNVINYSYVDFDKWNIDMTDIAIGEKDINFYLIIDTLINDALIHWVAESAIYLFLFKELKETYPTLKLHLKTQKQYKKMICDHFEIENTDVVIELLPNNVCFFPLPISSLNKNTICPDYIAQLNRFCNFIQSSVTKDVDKSVSVLFMPRQTKENFAGNDRTYNTQEISNKISEVQNSMILNTDNIKSLQEQIDIVNSSKNIIVTGGSSYFFNGILSNSANLIVLDAPIHNRQIQQYIKLKYCDDLVRMRNIVNDIPLSGAFKFDNIKTFLKI